MKRFYLLALCLVIVAPILRAAGNRYTAGTDAFISRFTVPFYIARLYTRTPDQVLQMPIRKVKTEQIGDTWRAPRSGQRQHEGQDIFAPRGSEILSATEGVVVRIGENNLGGRTVSVLGAGGRVYYYAHLEDYAPGLAVGDRVGTTTVLGYVGTSGNARGTPPHLHFGVYQPAGAINPLPLLANREAKNAPPAHKNVSR
jgi:murein DD-endopeptidase MepM/ murein hydrolase activator NlpD